MQVTLHGNSHKAMREAEEFLLANPTLWKAIGSRFSYRVALSGGHHISERARVDYRYHRALTLEGLVRF